MSETSRLAAEMLGQVDEYELSHDGFNGPWVVDDVCFEGSTYFLRAWDGGDLLATLDVRDLPVDDEPAKERVAEWVAEAT